jgi:hypothetical protein
MLLQVVGSLFALMEEYEPAWIKSEGSEDVELLGFRFGVALAAALAVGIGGPAALRKFFVPDR